MKKLSSVLFIGVAAILMALICKVEIVHAADYNLWIGETQVTDKNMNDIKPAGSTGKASFTPATGTEPDTLTLENFRFKGKGYKDKDVPYYGAIFYKKSENKNELKIVVTGNNSIEEEGDNNQFGSIGIYSDCNVTITGSGSLEAKGGPARSESYGILTEGNCRIEGLSSLKASSTSCNNMISIGIRSFKDLFISDTDVTVEGDIQKSPSKSSYGIQLSNNNSVRGTLTVTKSKVNAVSPEGEYSSYGIYCGKAVFTDSLVTASGGSVLDNNRDASSAGIGIYNEEESGCCLTSVNSVIEARGGEAGEKSSQHDNYSTGLSIGTRREKSSPLLLVKGGSIRAKASEARGNGAESIGIVVYRTDDQYNFFYNEELIVLEEGASLWAGGYTQAIKGNVRNTFGGIGWTDIEGKEGETFLPAKTTEIPSKYRSVKLLSVSKPVIKRQPSAPGEVFYGEEGGRSLSIEGAVTDEGTLGYQWYHNTTNSTSGGTPISGATKNTYTIPLDEKVGEHFYYCRVTDTIYNTSEELLSNVIKVVVKYREAKVYLKKKNSTTIVAGSKLQLVPNFKIKSGTWKSSNKKVATVSKKGLVTAKAKGGKATITVKSSDGKKTATFTINVAQMTIKKSSLTLKAGSKTKKSVSVTLFNDKIAKVTSKDKTIAKASFKNKTVYITPGKIKGKTEITVTSKLGIKRVIKVKVTGK